ncbi:MAG: pyridoxamine 5'-phosphate oxidase family protein [Clostridiales Family XIII bacterium]|jgi:nitroimidazol reductase NimA-like FMN-containing flavoprotein (pyridoxamine 5'-phosphate oxidase superfamily)|nr:pyridoxamine 5'-phosphate oxidase family protein [Clostridiales Family XIII bacterium]
MRKANREIKNQDEIVSILEKCDVCRLGLARDGIPYIVPMSFGYEWAGGRLILYFHCAKEGKKLDIMRENANACFEMDCSHELKPGEAACDYSMNFESIIGSGRIAELAGREERIHGLTCLMKKYSAAPKFVFSESALALTAVLRLEVSEYAGKRLMK